MIFSENHVDSKDKRNVETVREEHTSSGYVRPRIITHSSKKLDQVSLTVSACTSFGFSGP